MNKIAFKKVFVFIFSVILMSCGKAYIVNEATKSEDPLPPVTSPEPQQVVYNIGDSENFNLIDESFNMVYVPSGLTFPINLYDTDTATSDTPYFIAETHVTYALWYEVVSWAVNNAYFFENLGKEGSMGQADASPTANLYHPVTHISWRDAVVWSNALTEYFNELNNTDYTVVYTYNNQPIRNSSAAADVAFDNLVEEIDADGFRLPSSMEWELSARYRGSNTVNTVQAIVNDINFSLPEDGIFWTRGNSASGASSDTSDEIATRDVAWYLGGSNSTSEVCQLRPNALGLCDMTGNAFVWTSTWIPNPNFKVRTIRGGSYNNLAGFLRLGFPIGMMENAPDTMLETVTLGMRLAKTAN